MPPAPPALTLVPTDRHVEEGLASSAGAVRTLRGFVADALTAAAPERRIATPTASSLATKLALDAVEAPWRTMDRTWPRADSTGPEGIVLPDDPGARVLFADVIDGAIGRLRRAGASPSQLRTLREAPLAQLVADTWDRVDALLTDARLIDARSVGAAFASRLEDGALDTVERDLGVRFDGGVRVTGIVAWEPDDLAWLESLHRALRARGSPGVSVELPRVLDDVRPDVAPCSLYGASDGEGDPIESIADALERRWASLLDAPEIEWLSPRQAAAERVIEARDADGEARAVVATLLEELDRRTPPERIAIVVPGLEEERLEPLRATLADAGVSFVEPRGRPCTGSPEGRVALTLLALARGPVHRDQLIELCRAPGVHAGAWVEHANSATATHRAALLAHRLREVPVRADRTGLLFVEALAAASRAEDAWMARAVGKILSSARWLGAGTTRGEIVRRLLQLVDTIQLGSPSAGELSRALRAEEQGPVQVARGHVRSLVLQGPVQGARGHHHGADTAKRALRALGEGTSAVRRIREAAQAIADAAEVLGRRDAASSADELAAELELATAHTRAPSLRAGAVRIVRAADLCGLDVDLAIVTGLETHAYGGEMDPVLDERLCAGLDAPFRPPMARERRARARAELAWALAGARRAVLSWSRARGGAEIMPHPLVVSARSRGSVGRMEPASRVAREASVVDARGAGLVAIVAGAPAPPGTAQRAMIERGRAAFFLDPRASAGPFTGRITLRDGTDRDHLVACIGGHAPSSPIAVTHVERAAGCAFAGFARRVLRVRRMEDVDEAADPRERGTMVHRALRAAFEAASTSPDDPEKALDRAHAAARRALDLSASMTPLRREAVLRAIADATRVVARSLASNDPLRFMVGERHFGAEEQPPWDALKLEAPDGRHVYLDGQIDRIDRTADGRAARVVDYKTGKLPEVSDLGTTALQLPLYAAVVARALGTDDVIGSYVRIASRGVIEEWPGAIDKQRAIAGARGEVSELARRVVLALWDGNAAPRPYRPTLCAKCDARDVCRRPAVVPVEEIGP